MRTKFKFKSDAFNTTESKDYFVNPDCYGDDLARWFIERLKAEGHSANYELYAEDFGWAFSFDYDRKSYNLIIGWRPDDRVWLCWIERRRHFLLHALGFSRRMIDPEVLSMIHGLLERSNEAHDIQWAEPDSEDEEFHPTPFS